MIEGPAGRMAGMDLRLGLTEADQSWVASATMRQTRPILAATILCAAILAGPRTAAAQAPANSMPDFVVAFDRGDFPSALSAARPLAEKGDVQAQKILALLYSSGWGVPQDYQKAAAWYEKAAVQGWMAAQVNLGSLYATGKAVPQDDSKALFWWRKGADQGAAQAYYNLGASYENGRGVPQDFKEAAALYRRAAEISMRDWYKRNTPPH